MCQKVDPLSNELFIKAVYDPDTSAQGKGNKQEGEGEGEDEGEGEEEEEEEGEEGEQKEGKDDEFEEDLVRLVWCRLVPVSHFSSACTLN